MCCIPRGSSRATDTKKNCVPTRIHEALQEGRSGPLENTLRRMVMAGGRMRTKTLQESMDRDGFVVLHYKREEKNIARNGQHDRGH